VFGFPFPSLTFLLSRHVARRTPPRSGVDIYVRFVYKETPMPLTELSLTDKYNQVCQDYRFYGEMRFKQLTLFSAVTVLLFNLATSEKAVLLSKHANKTILGVAGIFFTTVFWIMELRSTMYGIKTRAEKERIEQRRARKWELITASNAVLCLYGVSYAFWFLVWKDAGAMTSRRLLLELLFLGWASCLGVYSTWQLGRIWRRLSLEGRLASPAASTKT
jgi:hypothetical protein